MDKADTDDSTRSERLARRAIHGTTRGAMIEIDGRIGGGQLLRTSLSLSALTQSPFEIERIRGSRPEPGLKPQHMAAVSAVAEFCQADVSGATTGSDYLTFRPHRLQPVSREVDIGTAGSITLLFDAVLPFLTRIDDSFELTATGGTDVKWSPSIDYFSQVKLPLLGRFGVAARTDIERTGFYPAGGGRVTLRADPSTLQPIGLVDRGPLDRVEVYSKAAVALEDRDVADRQARQATVRLEDGGLPVERTTVDYVETRSPGSVLVLRAVYEDSAAGFDGLGKRGKSAEAVADGVVDQFLDFHRRDAAVDTHLGDQLLVFLALTGGRIRTPEMTDHLESNASVIRDFGFDLRLDQQADGTVVARA